MKKFLIFLLTFVVILSFCFIPVSAASSEPSLTVTSLYSGTKSIPYSFDNSSLSFNLSDVTVRDLSIYFSLSNVDFSFNNGSFTFDVSCNNSGIKFSLTPSRFNLYGLVDSSYVSIGSVTLHSDRLSFFVGSDFISSNITEFYFTCGIVLFEDPDDVISFQISNFNVQYDTSSFVHLYKYLGSFFSWSLHSISSILFFISSNPSLLISFAIIIILFVLYYFKRLERGGSS